MRVLIVDDSRAVQTIVRREVQQASVPELEFQTAMDGESALPLIANWKPDLVLTDWHMPGMSGLELLKVIRREHADAIRVGIVTTETGDENIAEALRQGARFVLAKPFKGGELSSRVAECLLEAVASPATEETPVNVSVSIAPDEQVVRRIHPLLQGHVTVTPLSTEANATIQPPSLVGLFVVEESKQVRGLCVLDYPAMIIVGETMKGKPFPDIRKSLAAKTVEATPGKELMRLVSVEIPALFQCSDQRVLRAAKTQILRKDVPQLQNLITRSLLRRDFAISRGDLPSGRLTLVSQ
jgi:DNA-binding response OmpR family regulator